ncbi:TIGR02217 family protein [Pseudomonas grimontii]|uniref:TIGR02217 family protein n=1 Tax=Pseudomonas grimontii TaxID=129847 RepID=A0A1H1ILG2_9PSED|nr:DUF2460 domain-containing protein [Pseudomonas grimontii]TWR64422.1 hypothetical protein FIV39_19760 [Pseudomonas grimontii]SDR38490.1 TIGR02217 family protein [Pseudomonas grimontii]
MSLGPFWPARWIASYPDVGVVAEGVLPRLPGQTLLSKKAPEWSTGVQKTVSGRRRTTAYYPAPLWSFKLSYNVLRKRPGLDEWSTLIEFFNQRKGQFGEFLFFDRSDHLVTLQRFGTGDGTTQTFQLSREIGNWVEPVYGVVNVDVVTVGGVPISAFSVDELGRITFAVAPPDNASLVWSGAFYFRCAFEDDSLDGAQPYRTIWELKSIAFTSIKP